MRLVLAAVVGLLAPFVFILGAAPLEVQGRNSPSEIVAGAVAVLLYSAVCQVLLARQVVGPARARGAIPVTTVASLLAERASPQPEVA